MKQIRVAIIPHPVAGPRLARRETIFDVVRREWRGFWKSSGTGYSEA